MFIICTHFFFSLIFKNTIYIFFSILKDKKNIFKNTKKKKKLQKKRKKQKL